MGEVIRQEFYEIETHINLYKCNPEIGKNITLINVVVKKSIPIELFA